MWTTWHFVPVVFINVMAFSIHNQHQTKSTAVHTRSHRDGRAEIKKKVSSAELQEKTGSDHLQPFYKAITDIKRKRDEIASVQIRSHNTYTRFISLYCSNVKCGWKVSKLCRISHWASPPPNKSIHVSERKEDNVTLTDLWWNLQDSQSRFQVLSSSKVLW